MASIIHFWLSVLILQIDWILAEFVEEVGDEPQPQDLDDQPRDLNGDGLLDFDELLVYEKRVSPDMSPEENQESVRFLIKTHDLDKDGKLSPKELQGMPDYHHFDRNHDDVLQESEVEEFFRFYDEALPAAEIKKSVDDFFQTHGRGGTGSNRSIAVKDVMASRGDDVILSETPSMGDVEPNMDGGETVGEDVAIDQSIDAEM
eukprot:TRINITY_DN13118_c0_g2_i1.p1 TRINITY_DN13118_c0_g2~~TRINITY_DN13118_c0_g2_i1.p1  ORF type:complete len:203 (+),score=41.75 TRINITY_DN13118_c0_g2_i1:83-691(+)